MPRYFFHFREQNHLHQDEEGMELPDFDAALCEALRVQRELTMDRASPYELYLQVTDTSGHTLIQVPIVRQQKSTPDWFN